MKSGTLEVGVGMCRCGDAQGFMRTALESQSTWKCACGISDFFEALEFMQGRLLALCGL